MKKAPNHSNTIKSICFLTILLCPVWLIAACAHDPAPPKVDKPTDPDTVLFEGSTAFGIGGGPRLTGRLRKPQGRGPFPAVVLLHGCGGVSPKRDHRWSERLVGWGYATLQVDSLGPRGISSVCTYSGRESLDIIQKRIRDAYDAKRYLEGLSFVDPARIAVMGWSHGAGIALQVLYHGKEAPFSAAAAFYPPCRSPLTGLNAPLLIMAGEADDWTPASRCVSAMPKGQGATEVLLKVYPGAHHGFDTPGANFDVRGSTGMHHVQYRPDAEADSIGRVKAFFERHFK